MSRHLLLAAAVLLTGCDRMPPPFGSAATGASTAPAVAVLDLAAVASALGRDDLFREQVQAAGQQLNEQLAALSSSLQTRLREEQAKLGEAPTEAEQRQLQTMLADARRQVQQGQAEARQKAARYQAQLVAQFRGEVQPVAAEVARSHGASAVVLANTVLWFEPEVDITGEVIDALRARGAAAGAPAAAVTGGAQGASSSSR
jgi:Skp family chaperone for outer membrane proteins